MSQLAQLLLIFRALYLRYPGQERVGGDLKIPTIIWYDQSGAVKAAGAEATKEGIDIEASENQWVKAEWLLNFLHRREPH